MIHFGKCIKYQYRDTILNQVSVSVSRYNLEVSYPTLPTGRWHRQSRSVAVRPRPQPVALSQLVHVLHFFSVRRDLASLHKSCNLLG